MAPTRSTERAGNHQGEMKKYITEVLRTFYTKKRDADQEVVVYRLRGPELIGRGYRSNAFRIKTQLGIRPVGQPGAGYHPQQKSVVVKEYPLVGVIDSTGREHDEGRILREPKALRILGDKTQHLPELMDYVIDRKNRRVRIVMEDLGDVCFAQEYAPRDSDSLAVLAVLSQQENMRMDRRTLESRLDIDEARVDRAIERLKLRGYVHNTQRSGIINVVDKANTQYDLSRGHPVETFEYGQVVIGMFKKGLTAIFEVQRLAKQHTTKLRATDVPRPTVEVYTERLMAKLETVVKGYYGTDSREQRGFEQAYNEVRALVSSEISTPLADHVSEHNGIIQGDCHPLNMLVRSIHDKTAGDQRGVKTVALLDLFHMTGGVWLEDVVEFLKWAKITKVITPQTMDELLHIEHARRIEEQMPYIGCNRRMEPIEDMKRLARICETQRNIIDLGSVSGMLIYHGDKYGEGEQIDILNWKERYGPALNESLINHPGKTHKVKRLRTLLSDFIPPIERP